MQPAALSKTYPDWPLTPSNADANGRFRCCVESIVLAIARLDEPALCSFERKCRQDAVAIGAGVDADSVLENIGLRANCMPMDHDEPMVRPIAEKRLADPAQVGS